MPQHEEVIKVMKQNNGYATLGYLYQHVNTSTWKTKTPFESIRRIVQQKKEIFFKIKPGLWALMSEREKVLKQFDILKASPKQQEVFDHTYYQGLIVEIGNITGYSTYVPNQDKNRKYLEKPLSNITKVDNIYNFSYDRIVGKARTIDAIWFNRRKLPSYFFEVEHSTDFYNSFIKFHELQDFHSKFIIVSSEKKHKQYIDKLNNDIFDSIRDRVEFMGYEKLSKWHTTSSEQAKLKLF